MPDSESIGRAGEYFTGYILELRGTRTTHVDIYGHDLWVRTRSGRMLTVQVKAASRPTPEPRSKLRYHFKNRSKVVSDVYSFVALDIPRLLLFDSMPGNRAITVESFTDKNMEESIERLLY